MATGSPSEDAGLIPKPGFFGETATSQLTETGVYIHHGTIPPVMTPGHGDQAYFAAGGSLFRMSPDGSVQKLATESSLNVSAPLVARDESLFYRTDQGELVSLAADGSERWRQNAGGISAFPMGLSQDGQSLYTVNVGADGRHEVTVRDAATGVERYPLQLQPTEQLVGMLDDKTMLVTGRSEDEHYLQIVRPDGRGRKVGGLDTPAHGPNAWLGTGNQVFVRDTLGRLTAVEASSGHKNWTYPGPMKDLFLSPDGSMLAAMGRKLTQISAAGDPGWTKETPAPVGEGSFDARGNFFTTGAGQLTFITSAGELESTPWSGSVRASGSGMLFQVSSPDPQAGLQQQGNLALGVASASLGFIGGALGGLLSKKGLKKAISAGANSAGKAYDQAYQPGVPAAAGPNRTQGDHRIQAVRFLAKKDLLASVQEGMRGSTSAIEERDGRLIVGGVAVRRKS